MPTCQSLPKGVVMKLLHTAFSAYYRIR